MENKTIQQQLESIQQQLNYIVSEIEAERRRRRELEELKSDLNLIARDVFQAAVEELDGVAQHIDTGDVLHLLKKLLRNVRNLSKLMDQLESLMSFVEDAGPLTKEVVLELMQTLDELDRKGYFDFMAEALKIIDTIVTSFTVEDVRLLRENIAHILITVKNLTQPEMLATVNNALSFFKEMDIEIEEEVSYWKIFKALRDPEMRRGIAFMIQFLKNMASKNGELLKPLQSRTETKQED
ncbi:MAG: DUF1641 domain-containing protein [Calditrichaeota bacterium]|nr:DUF1641 domain-containing protein [Calditrichota bacterium]